MPDITTHIFNQPLMIHPGKLESILGVIKDKYDQKLPADANTLQVIGKREKYHKVKNTAIIPIQGTLTHKISIYQAMSGMVNYAAIGNMIDKAIEDKTVDRLLLDINSGGGHVQGCFDLVDKIHAARSKKQIIAIVDENAYSAAYAIASACHKIYLPRTAGVGSIGVISAHVNMAKFNKKIGREVTYVYAGDKKADLRSDQPLSDSAKADLQSDINKVYDLFIKTVARNRNLTEDKIRETQAGTYMGEDAVKAGLADKVMSVDQILNEVIREKSTMDQGDTNKTSEVSSLTERLLAAIQQHEATDSRLSSSLKALMNSSRKSDPELISGLTDIISQYQSEQKDDIEKLLKAQRDKSLTVRQDIFNICKTVGRPDLAGELLIEEMSLEEARTKLTDLMGKEDEKIPTISSLRGEEEIQEENPLLTDADRRVKEAAHVG